MIFQKNFLIILFLLFMFAFNSVAQEKDSKNNKIDGKSKYNTETKIETKKIWNAFCPVMGEPVDPEVQTVEYNGKVIGFCCKSCIKKFNKDPEKYLKNLSEDGQKFIK